MNPQYIFLNKLAKGGPSGVLDTPEKVEQATYELQQSLEGPFEELRLARIASLEASCGIVLD